MRFYPSNHQQNPEGMLMNLNRIYSLLTVWFWFETLKTMDRAVNRVVRARGATIDLVRVNSQD